MSVAAGDWTHLYDPSTGENERWYVNDHTFIRDATGLWHLIGITHQEPFKPLEEVDLCHATAPSLLGPWTKHPPALSADASWGELHLWAPHVIEHDGAYWMFVCGGSLDGGETYRIHLATSDDCFTWTRHPENPLVVHGFHARDPMVLRVGDRWVMYYTATSAPKYGNHVVIATESDLVHWSGRTMVYRDEFQGDHGGPTESPFVVERAGTYYLFMGPADYGKAMAGELDWATAYSSTIVLASDDPLHFDRADCAGEIATHASEVIVDEDGNDWISHCGWGQGGVYLAPLRFDGSVDEARRSLAVDPDHRAQRREAR